jgi:hypothetical protein
LSTDEGGQKPERKSESMSVASEGAVHSDVFSNVDLRPWIVRHRPRADHVYPHDFCKLCGDAGFYYCISKTDPENVWDRPCENPKCQYKHPDFYDDDVGPIHLSDEIDIELELEDEPRGQRSSASKIDLSDAISGTITSK